MMEDGFQVLTSHPALISSDISQLRLIIISQEINSLVYNNISYKIKIEEPHKPISLSTCTFSRLPYLETSIMIVFN